MNRPYSKKDILNKFKKLNSKIKNLSFGTDVIIGFPTETDSDFEETYKLCQGIGFQKIHTFKYSSRPDTMAKKIYDSNPKIYKEILQSRSQKIRNLTSKLSTN